MERLEGGLNFIERLQKEKTRPHDFTEEKRTIAPRHSASRTPSQP